jgi:hypothetical protein
MTEMMMGLCSKRVQSRLALYHGVRSLYIPFSDDAEETFCKALAILQVLILPLLQLCGYLVEYFRFCSNCNVAFVLAKICYVLGSLNSCDEIVKLALDTSQWYLLIPTNNVADWIMTVLTQICSHYPSLNFPLQLL